MKLQAARERWKTSSFLLIQQPKARVLQHADHRAFPRREGSSLQQLVLERGTGLLTASPKHTHFSFHVRTLRVSFQGVSRSRRGTIIILWCHVLCCLLGSSFSGDEIGYTRQHHFQSLFGCQGTLQGDAVRRQPPKPQLTLDQQIAFCELKAWQTFSLSDTALLQAFMSTSREWRTGWESMSTVLPNSGNLRNNWNFVDLSCNCPFVC